MKLKVASITKQTKNIFLVNELLHSAFPKNELLPFWFLLQRAKNNSIDFLALYDDEAFIGFTYLVTNNDLTFILYLAISNPVRSKGYGKIALETIQAKYPNNRIVLNIEAIENGAPNYEQRVSRKSFYIKNGYKNTSLIFTEGCDKYEVLISKMNCTIDEYQQIYKKLAGSLLYCFYKHRIKFI